MSDRARVWLWPLVILVALLGAWEWLTGIKAISRTPGLYWIDPFFVSRPSLILARLAYLAGGEMGLLIWRMALSTVQSTVGARSVDADLSHAARVLGGSDRQIMRTVIVPSALAWTFASLTPSISFALIGVVVGEFLGGESGGGLGYLIIQSLGTLNAADMMVALIALGVIGIVMALGIKQVETRLLRWRPEYRRRA